MKAIVTKYHGPTNARGARISASDTDRNRISIPYPHELSGEDVYRKAAQALCLKMKWPTSLIGGGTKDGYIFVFAYPVAKVLRTLAEHAQEQYPHFESVRGRQDIESALEMLAEIEHLAGTCGPNGGVR